MSRRHAARDGERRAARHASGRAGVGERAPRRRRRGRRHDAVPGVSRRRLPRHGAVARQGEPHALRRVRHEAGLAGLPDRLLHLPPRPAQRRPEPESRRDRDRRVGVHAGRRARSRSRSTRAIPDGDPLTLRIVSQPAHGTTGSDRHAGDRTSRSRASPASIASRSPPGTAPPTRTSRRSPSTSAAPAGRDADQRQEAHHQGPGSRPDDRPDLPVARSARLHRGRRSHGSTAPISTSSTAPAAPTRRASTSSARTGERAAARSSTRMRRWRRRRSRWRR